MTKKIVFKCITLTKYLWTRLLLMIISKSLLRLIHSCCAFRMRWFPYIISVSIKNMMTLFILSFNFFLLLFSWKTIFESFQSTWPLKSSLIFFFFWCILSFNFSRSTCIFIFHFFSTLNNTSIPLGRYIMIRLFIFTFACCVCMSCKICCDFSHLIYHEAHL